jgi:hypothetical protein
LLSATLGQRSGQHLAAGQIEDAAGHESRFVGRQKDIHGRELGRLGGSLHGVAAAEFLHCLFRHGGWNERRPDRARRDGVYTHALLNGERGERFGERNDGALGAGVRQQRRAGLVGLHGSGVDYRAALAHIR